MPRQGFQEELKDLRTQLAEPPASASDTAPQGAGAKARAGEEIALDAQLKELGSALADAADDAGDSIKRHPLASVAAALLLGFVAGRTTGRF